MSSESMWRCRYHKGIESTNHVLLKIFVIYYYYMVIPKKPVKDITY